MKKYLFALFCTMFALQTQAQIVRSTSSRITTTRVAERTPTTFIDLGVGGYTDDADDTGIDLGLRFTKMYHPYVGWDIFKISAQTSLDNIDEALNIQAKTGVRGVTPVLFGNSGTLYANLALGYGYYTDVEEGGVAWEIGAGANFNKNISLGISYNRCDYTTDVYWGEEDVEIGLFTVRLSIGF